MTKESRLSLVRQCPLCSVDNALFLGDVEILRNDTLSLAAVRAQGDVRLHGYRHAEEALRKWKVFSSFQAF